MITVRSINLQDLSIHQVKELLWVIKEKTEEWGQEILLLWFQL